MNPVELSRVQSHLRRLLGAPDLNLRAKGADEADVLAGDAKVAELTKDEDEGEISYFFTMGLERAQGAARKAPLDASERVRLQGELRQRLGAPKLDVRERPRKTDSAEVYVGDEFIGTLSADEAPGRIGYFLTISILDIDLDEA